MKTPTEEQIAEYESRLDAIIAARRAGAGDAESESKLKKLESDLKSYMLETGIADEPPVTDFPELGATSPDTGGES